MVYLSEYEHSMCIPTLSHVMFYNYPLDQGSGCLLLVFLSSGSITYSRGLLKSPLNDCGII